MGSGMRSVHSTGALRLAVAALLALSAIASASASGAEHGAAHGVEHMHQGRWNRAGHVLKKGAKSPFHDAEGGSKEIAHAALDEGEAFGSVSAAAAKEAWPIQKLGFDGITFNRKAMRKDWGGLKPNSKNLGKKTVQMLNHAHGGRMHMLLESSSLAALQARKAVAPLSPPTRGKPGGLHGYKLVFHDEFSGSHLDTRVWSQGWYAADPATDVTVSVQASNDLCYSPDRVAVHGGALQLSMVREHVSCGGQQRSVSSGMVTTRESAKQYLYGFFEARIWVTASADGKIANWPAWWLVGNSQEFGEGHGELDIFEGLDGSPCWHFVYQQAPGSSNEASEGACSDTLKNWGGSWHTYAAEWTPNAVHYFYDGKLQGSLTQHLTHHPMYLLLNFATTWQDGQWTDGGKAVQPAVMKVDYVRVYQKE